MSLWRQLTRGLRGLTNRSAADRDLADEVQLYLEHATAEQVARGLSPEDAARAARREMGNVTAIREEVRSYGWENLVLAAAADLRYAIRWLRASPGFTIVTVLTLAVGLGATTAIFSAVTPILFEPLPYPRADRVAAIVELGADGSRRDGTFGMYRSLAERDRLFDAMAVYKPWLPVVTGADRPERLGGERVSAGYFRVLGVPPTLGRDFLPADDLANGPNVVILSDALWRRRFHGDPGVLGQAISLGDRPYVVIGVMPKGFEDVLAPSADVWAPLQYDMTQGAAWGHHLHTIGRLRSGVTTDQATREISSLGAAVLQDLHPETYGKTVLLAVASLKHEITAGVKPALLIVLAAVTLVLMIACVNVTNLLLARSVQRRSEFAVRAALGAGQFRMVRQLLTECLLLAAAGGAVGLGLAIVGVRALIALSPPGLPRAGAIGIDRTVFLIGVGVTTLIGLLFGLIPALQAAHSDPQAELHGGSRRVAGGHRRVRGALVAAEVALAFMLLVGSGLLWRSLQRLFAIPSGIDSAHVLTMRVMAEGRRFDADSDTHRFFGQALAAVRQVPGVESAGFTSQLPLSGDDDEYGAQFVPDPSREPGRGPVFRYAVTPGYLETLRIPLRQGRAFGRQDRAGTPPVALIGESMARRRLPGIEPVGQRVRLGDGPALTVVGVVGDVKQQSLAVSDGDAVYVVAEQSSFPDHELSLVVRTRGPAASVTSAVRQAIWSVDRNVPIVRVGVMDDLVAATAAERRFLLILFEGFGLAALVLAAAGIYGVLSGSVAERTREIGVRSALGASRREIVALVVRQGMSLTLVGAAIGVAGAVAATRAIAALLFGVSRLDAVTYGAVAGLLLVVSLIACWVPAWRAARVDPVITLRAG